MTFDLRTGKELQLTDLVANSPQQLTVRMHGAINRRFGEALATAAKVGADTATLTYMTEALHWHSQTKRVRFDNSAEDAGARPPEFQDFALTPKAVLIFYSADFHRLRSSFEPDATYRFPYSGLQFKPLLQPLAGQNAKVK